MERQHADYRPPAYRNPSQPPFTATRDAYVPGTDGMRAYDTHFFRIPGHERPEIPPNPGHEVAVAPDSGPRGLQGLQETRFDYIEAIWAENDQG